MSKRYYDDYVNARLLFKEWSDHFESVIPVEFGTVNAPGLSDLDLGLVFGRTYQMSRKQIKKRLQTIPKEVVSIMNGGTLMLFPEKEFMDISYVDDVCVKSLGNPVHLSVLSERDKELVDVLQIIEWLPERIVKIYIELACLSRNSKRLVGYFYSLCYTLEKVLELVEADSVVHEYIKNVKCLRDGWSEDSKEHVDVQIKLLSEMYLSVFEECVRVLDTVFERYFRAECSGVDEIAYNIYAGVNLVASTKHKELYGKIKRNGDEINVYLPCYFLLSYQYYSGFDFILSRKISNRFLLNKKKYDGVRIKLPDEVDSILQKRINVVGGMFDFARSIGAGYGSYKFGWYIND